jgi:hypothetical protein
MIKNYNNQHIKEIARSFIDNYYKNLYIGYKPIKAEESKQENK